MIDNALYVQIRRRLASLQAGVLLVGAALLLVLAFAVDLVLRNEYHREVDDVLNDSERTARKLAFRTTEVFDRVNQSTQLVRYLSERRQLPSLQSLRQGGVLADDVTRVVFVTDPKGFVADSTSDLVALNIADEDYFKQHKKQAGLEVQVGIAVPDPLAGGWSIPVSRRMNSPNGDFAGLVTAAIDPNELSAGFAMSEAPDTVIGVLGLDGIYRSRRADGKMSFGGKVDVARLEQRVQQIQASRLPLASSIDGVERFVASVRVERYPLVAVVAVNAETALAGYRRARTQVLGWAATLAALIMAGMFALHVKIRQLQSSRHRTRQAEAAFRATLEGSLDAVTLLRAQRDAAGTLADMVVVDCNARAAAMLDHARAEVIGKSLCQLAPSIRTGGFLARFDKVIESGSTSSAEILATEPLVAGRWLHHQVVPLEDGVALITRDITERKLAEHAMAGLAHLDALTQLGNRRDFEQRLAQAWYRVQRSGQTLALLLLDLDGFKAVNDKFGHAAGDTLLIEVAKRLSACVRVTDAVSRLGGDEFTVILEGAGSPQDIGLLCERIVQSLSQPHVLNGQHAVSTPSVGVAVLEAGESFEALIHRADTAMYNAKRSGKAMYRFAVTGTAGHAIVADPAPAPARANANANAEADAQVSWPVL